MRKKIKSYVVACDVCFDHIEGKIYQGDIFGETADLCEACYINNFGTTWQYIWFKIQHWVFAIVAVIISYFLCVLSEERVPTFWGSLVTLSVLYYFYTKGRKEGLVKDRRRKQEVEYLIKKKRKKTTKKINKS